MIYKQNVSIPSSNKVVEHNISACIKCGCDDIHLDEYEDNFGFISTAKCRNCKQELKLNVSITSLITQWNDANNILIVIADRERLIASAKKEIKELKNRLNKQKNVSPN
jgi:hypothetical protein